MRHVLYLSLLLCLVFRAGQAQDSTRLANPDTLLPAAPPADDLLGSLTETLPPAQLLPDHMLLSQRMFWGKKGLMRITNVVPLTLAGREKELNIRRTMLNLHQIGGFITLAGFLAQGIVGSQLYSAQGADYTRLLDLHRGIGTATNIAYATTTLLSLSTPPATVGRRRGLSTITLHKYLAVVHLAGMIATNVLGNRVRENDSLKPYHRAAAYTTFGAYAISVLVLKF